LGSGRALVLIQVRGAGAPRKTSARLTERTDRKTSLKTPSGTGVCANPLANRPLFSARRLFSNIPFLCRRLSLRISGVFCLSPCIHAIVYVSSSAVPSRCGFLLPENFLKNFSKQAKILPVYLLPYAQKKFKENF